MLNCLHEYLTGIHQNYHFPTIDFKFHRTSFFDHDTCINMIQTRIYVNYKDNFIHKHFVLQSVAYCIINGVISRKRSNLNLIDFRERLYDMRNDEQSIEVVVTICVDNSAPVKFLM